MVGNYLKIFNDASSGVKKFSFIVFLLAVSGQRPNYPSSKPTKNWDKLEAEVKQEVYDFVSWINKHVSCSVELSVNLPCLYIYFRKKKKN